MDSVALLKSKTAAVVTTFRPDASLAANLELISPQVAVVVLVDDTGAGNISDQTYPIDNLIVIRNAVNVGIAKSLNVGIARAAEEGCEWIITLDDDTRVRPDYVKVALEFFTSAKEPNLGIVALSRPAEGDPPPPSPASHRVRRNIITSGSVSPLELFRTLNGFSEDLFIDLVDFDFCCRARKAGRTLVVLDEVGMEHRVGDSETCRWLGWQTTVYHHAPFRLYYQARNAIVFARRHFAFDPLLCLVLLADVVRLPVKAILFERDRANRLRHIVAGVRDALRGRLGRLT